MSTCLIEFRAFAFWAGTLLAVGGLVAALRQGQLVRQPWLWIGLLLNSGGLFVAVSLSGG
ncbi:MAG TPA: hypothetical protein VFF69_12680 [Phycisphaerales bacterium]|nr:hypothetical protein [Phycisphaerales bacterium]